MLCFSDVKTAVQHGQSLTAGILNNSCSLQGRGGVD